MGPENTDLREHACGGPCSRRDFIRAGAAALLLVPGRDAAWAEEVAARLDIDNRYSPLNSRRPVRPKTDYIILHTTEGSETGSLNKIRRYGEAHYFVTLRGKVYRIITREKIALHTGRSMWEGQRTVDNFSLGIEVVGYHNKDIAAAQYGALKELLRQLKNLYRIPDDRVLTHSMVAYGSPNRFHSENHRGRKRCGMIFARPDVRARLGLNGKPEADRDVAEGRLRVADPELHRFLYARAPAQSEPGKVAQEAPAIVPIPAEPTVIEKGVTPWSIARERYNHADTTYILPAGERLRGDQIGDWSRIPVGTRVVLAELGENQGFEGFREIGRDGNTPRDLAGAAYADKTTIYFFPDGLVRTGFELKQKKSTRNLLEKPPKGTRLLVGYVYGGHVKARRSPRSIAGVKWNYPSTYYRFPDGRIRSGDEVDASEIPAQTLVFYQN